MHLTLGAPQSRTSVVAGNAVVPLRAKQRFSAFRVNPEQMRIDQIEELVLAGRQKEICNLFADVKNPPARLGEWELRVNIRLLNSEPVGRTIHAIPLTVRTRMIFEEGSINRLKSLGYTDDEARCYYKYAWKKKYVWVEEVLTCVKEMIDSFHVENVLESYQAAGDPRRLANTTGVPANPYAISHSHFLVAIDMARRIIRQRRAKEEVAVPKTNASEQSVTEMVVV